MNKEFVPYELALRMKQLGFDETCLGRYYNEEFEFDPSDWNSLDVEHIISAPLFQQAFRWLREKGYKYTISSDCFEMTGLFYFDAWKNTQFMFESGFEYATYEEAERVCLEKLIEIVELKSE